MTYWSVFANCLIVKLLMSGWWAFLPTALRLIDETIFLLSLGRKNYHVDNSCKRAVGNGNLIPALLCPVITKVDSKLVCFNHFVMTFCINDNYAEELEKCLEVICTDAIRINLDIAVCNVFAKRVVPITLSVKVPMLNTRLVKLKGICRIHFDVIGYVAVHRAKPHLSLYNDGDILLGTIRLPFAVLVIKCAPAEEYVYVRIGNNRFQNYLAAFLNLFNQVILL